MPDNIKQCPEGKVLNPVTNRCVKIKESKGKTIQACEDGKVLNPVTNRCVSISGKVGKSLINSKPVVPSNTCPPGQILACVDIKTLNNILKTEKPKSPNKAPQVSKSPKKNADGLKPKSPVKAPQVTESPKKNADGLKQARIWVRAPWRDMQNEPLKAGSNAWIAIYYDVAPFLERIFTIQKEEYALDAFSLRRKESDSIDMFVKQDMKYSDFAYNRTKIDGKKYMSRLKLINDKLNGFNRVELALLISNCIIAYYSYGYDGNIETLCFNLLKRYYSKDVQQIPYTKTLGPKALLKYQDNTFFSQLTGKWKSTLPNNLAKYPFNQLLPIPSNS